MVEKAKTRALESPCGVLSLAPSLSFAHFSQGVTVEKSSKLSSSGTAEEAIFLGGGRARKNKWSSFFFFFFFFFATLRWRRKTMKKKSLLELHSRLTFPLFSVDLEKEEFKLSMHKKAVLKLASGFRGRAGNCIRIARERVERALQYATRDRRAKKRDVRSLWIARINAGAREHGVRSCIRVFLVSTTASASMLSCLCAEGRGKK